jgi:hypothetical protein
VDPAEAEEAVHVEVVEELLFGVRRARVGGAALLGHHDVRHPQPVVLLHAMRRRIDVVAPPCAAEHAYHRHTSVPHSTAHVSMLRRVLGSATRRNVGTSSLGTVRLLRPAQRGHARAARVIKTPPERSWPGLAVEGRARHTHTHRHRGCCLGGWVQGQGRQPGWVTEAAGRAPVTGHRERMWGLLL